MFTALNCYINFLLLKMFSSDMTVEKCKSMFPSTGHGAQIQRLKVFVFYLKVALVYA